VDVPKITPSFGERVRAPLRASRVEILQINLGYRCNLECRHCHVKAGPYRKEVMSREIMEQCLEVLEKHAIPIVDITGGSPEMHPGFLAFLEGCSTLGRRVLVRSNGVLLLEREYESLLDLYAARKIEMVLSLPHIDPRTTDRQRGEGVFTRLVEVMRRLNARGYGRVGSGLVLDLVHNPAGAYLPGSQDGLESHYRRALGEKHGVVFDHLFCITNMPIGRYRDYLLQSDNYAEYMTTLVKAFNPASVKGVMCRSTVSVGWDGRLYDCDFNQMLGLEIDHGAPSHIANFDIDALASREVIIGDHCYGCTAGAGSSCQGTTT
jgi:radical SAM/Cys-rich protein